MICISFCRSRDAYSEYVKAMKNTYSGESHLRLCRNYGVIILTGCLKFFFIVKLNKKLFILNTCTHRLNLQNLLYNLFRTLIYVKSCFMGQTFLKRYSSFIYFFHFHLISFLFILQFIFVKFTILMVLILNIILFF